MPKRDRYISIKVITLPVRKKHIYAHFASTCVYDTVNKKMQRLANREPTTMG